MSDAPRAWRFYIDDMIAFAERVVSYTDGFDQAASSASGLDDDATLRNLELIGEAATHIPDEIRAAHPDIPWRSVIATRNRVVIDISASVGRAVLVDRMTRHRG